MIIQLIGLPASGKTLVAEKIKQKNKNIFFYDICSFYGTKREKTLYNIVKKYQNTPQIVLIESACGIENLSSIVIELRVSKSQYSMNQRLRKEFLTHQDRHRISDQMIPANFVLYDTKTCKTLIPNIINIGVPNATKTTKLSSKAKSS